MALGFFLNLVSCKNGQTKGNANLESQKKENISVKAVKSIEKKYGKKISIQEYVLSQDNDMFFERIATIVVFGKTTNGKLFKGPVMWFRNFFNEKVDTGDKFNRFFYDILTKPQEEDSIKKIVGQEGIYQQDATILLDSAKSVDFLADKFLDRIGNQKKMIVKPNYSALVNAKYSIAYLFYLKGYLMIEDDYEPETFFIPFEQVY
ncbi:hypothetical protein GCM10022218_50150 [Sphingobacterium ginsenosidimutans]|uniref:Lipoprotein n=3 Tax=Sphingobacterium TaxID=28453 RepID=A0ABP8ANP4_9SPHI